MSSISKIFNSDNGHGYHCLKAFEKETDWYEAEHMCQLTSGGHLTSIHSVGFNDRIRSLATNTFGTKKYWIGMTRNSVGGFQWSDGSADTFQHWEPGEPSGEWDGTVRGLKFFLLVLIFTQKFLAA